MQRRRKIKHSIPNNHEPRDTGKVTMELQDTFLGAYFGSCTDRFGVQWMFNCAEKYIGEYYMVSRANMIIALGARVEAPVELVWKCWTTPADIVKWNQASGDWHTPRAENDLRPGGAFSYRMEARDGSAGFDFRSSYEEVVPFERIGYTLGDGRGVTVVFAAEDGGPRVMESFEAEDANSAEQSIRLNSDFIPLQEGFKFKEQFKAKR